LCARFGAGRAVASEDVAEAMSTADGIVNTTPVGMAKFPGMALPAGMLSSKLWVADVIYFPTETQLCAKPGRAAAAPCPAPAWRCFKPPTRSACSAARSLTSSGCCSILQK
jgi:shikimate 5-dehydrogenase